ncbi:MAG: DUF1566 domain-containing protein [Proteobacteria bacterium]|nr:DUF1566 domain-containing protein [Pseudomonadota bacterium]
MSTIIWLSFFSMLTFGAVQASAAPTCVELGGFSPMKQGCKKAQKVWSPKLDKNVSSNEASSYCSSLPQENKDYRPWKLPTRDEAKEIFSNYFYDAMGGTSDDLFWLESSNVSTFSPVYQQLVTVASDGQANVICVSEPMTGWEDVTTVGDGVTTSTCESSPEHGSFRDRVSNLEWQKKIGMNYPWEDAVHYCKALSYNGKTDWRLPTLNELRGAFDEKSPPPFFEKMKGYRDLWSSTHDPVVYWRNNDLSPNYWYYVWHVEFGKKNYWDHMPPGFTGHGAVICVRP